MKAFAARIKTTIRFMVLFFWVLPIRREKNPNYKVDIFVGYLLTAMMLIVALSNDYPYVRPSDFPDLSKLSVVEGVLIRHPTRRDGKYVNEPIGLRTGTGDIFKECSRLGVTCFGGSDQPGGWQRYLGKPARMWFWEDWMIQLEIDGKIPDQLSYSHRANRFTSWNKGWIWMLLLVCPYVLFRLIQRYGKLASDEAFLTGATNEQAD